MLADLDLLLIALFCTADDLLPESTKNARRSVTDAEVVTLAVAQAMLKPSAPTRMSWRPRPIVSAIGSRGCPTAGILETSPPPPRSARASRASSGP